MWVNGQPGDSTHGFHILVKHSQPLPHLHTQVLRLNELSKRAASAFLVRSESRCRGRLSSSGTEALTFADLATGASYAQKTGA